MASKVYFTNLRATFDENLLEKLSRLIRTAGMPDMDLEHKFVAIKIHFGEPGNLAFLRPNYAKVVADQVREGGGKPFLTDCNTLYVGRRKHALEHLDAAYENGFCPFSTGCHVIIGDGLKGTDEALVPIPGDYVKEAKIGQAVMDADVVISLSHFKAHEATGIGGAIKNLGMGCGSRAGKMEMHVNGKPRVAASACIACGMCMKQCAQDAITLDEAAHIDHARCVGCGRCVGVCPVDAVEPSEDDTNDRLNCKISEYALAVLQGRPHFHIAFVMDVSPYCDCHRENDAPIIPDVGMFASFDPVALDKACADQANAQPALPGSMLESLACGDDHFKALHPTTDWMVGLRHAAKLGLGSLEYELIEI